MNRTLRTEPEAGPGPANTILPIVAALALLVDSILARREGAGP